jgi:hypothetical protein
MVLIVKSFDAIEITEMHIENHFLLANSSRNEIVLFARSSRPHLLM